MPRLLRLAPALALSVFALSGCDTTSSNSALEDIDGTYTVAELVFDPDARDLVNADIGARLDAAATRLVVFGDDEEALLTTQLAGEGSRRTDLRVSATRGRVTFEAITEEDRTDLGRLFLPAQFTLLYDTTTPLDLASEPSTTTTVDLNAFDPVAYSGLTAVPGKFRIRFTPVSGR